MSRVSFEALGGELGKYLSHAFNKSISAKWQSR